MFPCCRNPKSTRSSSFCEDCELMLSLMILVKSDRGFHPANLNGTTIPGRSGRSYGGGQTSMSAGYYPDCRTTIPKACAKELFDVKRP